jgi:Fe-S cluster assembly protein SufD
LTFTADALRTVSSGSPAWATARRADAFERFEASALPTEAEDLWKYSRVDEIDIGAYAPVVPGIPDSSIRDRARQVASVFGERSALVWTLDGKFAGAEGLAGDSGAAIFDESEVSVAPDSVRVIRDAFDDLHTAFAPGAVHIELQPKRVLDSPVVVVHLVTGGAGSPALFPHLYVHVGTSSELNVIELVTSASGGAANGLVLPATELLVEDDARLSHAYLQLLPDGWKQLAVQSARVGRDSSVKSFAASLGATTGRLRAEAELIGRDAEAILVAGYLGTGDQLHDLRTIQDHVAPRTRSQLLCMGAVLDVARSAYIGLTRVRNGARGADAFQKNRNLVLSEGAHADSVPNLDIEENDVRCSHSSTVGPIDEDQLYYLESRGIAPVVAERLIVLGFFRDLASEIAIPSVAAWFVDEASRRLAEHAATESDS